MPWSNQIFGFLIAGYIIYVVSRGELSKYLGFFVGTTSAKTGVKVTAEPTVASPWSAVTTVVPTSGN